MKRATVLDGVNYQGMNISIHTLCEEGDIFFDEFLSREKISIHTLCEEGDVDYLLGRTEIPISIHTLCEEGDTGIIQQLWG